MRSAMTSHRLRSRPGAGADRCAGPALGSSRSLEIGARVVIGGAGGRSRSIAAIVVGKQEFAGYWEYVLDEAIFTAPAHPFWGGSAMIGPKGDLCGIASLRLDQSKDEESGDQLNMIVPIDLLPPVLDDLKTLGRPKAPPRPWLGVYAVEVEGKVVVAGLADSGPAERAGLATGDVVLSVAGKRVDDARRVLPQRLGAWRGRRDRAAHRLSRGRGRRGRDGVRRPQPLPQGAPAPLRLVPGISEPAPGAGAGSMDLILGTGGGTRPGPNSKLMFSAGCRPAERGHPRSPPTRRCRIRTGA